jgi:sugar phosphate isomerase/epimerase
LQHWQAVRGGEAGTKFHDAAGFFDYARTLGADGVQTSIRAEDAASARAIRAQLEKDPGLYFEGELRLPEKKSELATFEAEARLAREAGATVARSVLMGSRRYETFKTLDEFRAFHDHCEQRLTWVEPVLREQKLKLAIENHKDHLAQEFADLLRTVSSEWIGALVDTGNNMALLEEPHAVVELLAPFALSVHFKDMAVQTTADGLLLSEVVLGEGCLDLPRIVATLRKANPHIVFNIEMATRDPLRVPCLTDKYWITFPERREKALGPAIAFAKANPPRHPVPRVAGLDTPARIALEESNNRSCLSHGRKLLS